MILEKQLLSINPKPKTISKRICDDLDYLILGIQIWANEKKIQITYSEASDMVSSYLIENHQDFRMLWDIGKIKATGKYDNRSKIINDIQKALSITYPEENYKNKIFKE